MTTYLNKSAAIIDLHERGFTEDFALIDGNILWIQGKVFIGAGEYKVVECHRFFDRNGAVSVIFCLLTNRMSVCGILMNHYTNATNSLSLKIDKKLKALADNLVY